MAETNELVANIFTKISHHRNISVLYLTQNVFDKNKYVRTISLNTHYLVLFKNVRDGTQFATLSRQMYPHSSKFATGLRRCHQRSLWSPVSRSKTWPRRTLSSKNEHFSGWKTLRLCKEIKGDVATKTLSLRRQTSIMKHSRKPTQHVRNIKSKRRRKNKKASIRWQDSAPPISGDWPTSERNTG